MALAPFSIGDAMPPKLRAARALRQALRLLGCGGTIGVFPQSSPPAVVRAAVRVCTAARLVLKAGAPRPLRHSHGNTLRGLTQRLTHAVSVV